MHDCPNCGQACDCDGEDTWNDAAQFGCEHDCEEEDDDGGQEGIEEGMDQGPRIVFPDFKACPFCGCTDVREYVDDGFYCEECGYGYIWTGQETEEQQAEIRKRWNTRPIEDALGAENERLRRMLAELEWLPSDLMDPVVFPNLKYCPICRMPNHHGHADGCRLAVTLGR